MHIPDCLFMYNVIYPRHGDVRPIAEIYFKPSFSDLWEWILPTYYLLFLP